MAQDRTILSGGPRRLLVQILSPGKSLTHRAMRAGFWSLLLRSLLRGIGFVRNIVLARLLAPDDFGLFGIALVILSIIERFTNTGLQSALVQREDDIKEYLDTAFTIQAARGAALALTLLLTAPYVALFFQEPRATPFIQLLGVSVFLRAMQNPGLLYYKRDLEVYRQTIHKVAGDIAELTVSIIAAIVLQNAWALMIGMLTGRVTGVVASYIVHPHRPRLGFRFEQARELGRYGRWIFLNNVLFFLAYRGDNFVIGKLLGAPALGIYMLAYSISEVITVEIGRVMTDIAFPAYSRIQGELERLQRAYIIAIELVASLTLPAGIALWLLARPITLALLNHRWVEVASVLPPLAIAGVIRALVANGSAAYKAVGRPERAFLVGAVGVVATYAAMFPLIKLYGLVGVAWSVLLGMAVSIPVSVYQARQILQLEWQRLARVLLPAAVLSAAVAVPILVVKHALHRITVAELALVVVLAGLVYLGTALLLWWLRREGPFRIIQLAQTGRRGRRAAPVPTPAAPAETAP